MRLNELPSEGGPLVAGLLHKAHPVTGAGSNSLTSHAAAELPRDAAVKEGDVAPPSGQGGALARDPSSPGGGLSAAWVRIMILQFFESLVDAAATPGGAPSFRWPADLAGLLLDQAGPVSPTLRNTSPCFQRIRRLATCALTPRALLAWPPPSNTMSVFWLAAAGARHCRDSNQPHDQHRGIRAAAAWRSGSRFMCGLKKQRQWISPTRCCFFCFHCDCCGGGYHLHIWWHQALCILAPLLEVADVDALQGRTWAVLHQPVTHAVRFFLDLFTARLYRRYPARLRPSLVREMSDPSQSPQVLSSLVMVAAYAAEFHLSLEAPKGETGSFDEHSEESPDEALKELLAAVLPYVSASSSFVRTVAQLLSHKLLARRLLPKEATEGCGDGSSGGGNGSLSDAVTIRLFSYLDKVKKRLAAPAENFPAICLLSSLPSLPALASARFALCPRTATWSSCGPSRAATLLASTPPLPAACRLSWSTATTSTRSVERVKTMPDRVVLRG